MTNTKNTLLVSCLLFLPTLLGAQSSAGPFGLTWGGTAQSFPGALVAEVHPNTNQLTGLAGASSALKGVSSALDVIQQCAAIGTSSAEDVGEYRLSYIDELADGLDFRLNEFGFDETLEGRISTYVGIITISDIRVPACVSYFDDRLQSVTIASRDFLSTENWVNFRERFRNKYGSPDEASSRERFDGSGTFFYSSWRVTNDNVSIFERSWVPKSISGPFYSDVLTYYYAPVASERVAAWERFYLTSLETRQTDDDI